MISIDSKRGRIALMVAHCAGMVDLVALPVWVGSLMQHQQLDPQRAGGLVTLFLAGAVVASLLLAPRLNRLPTRAVAAAGFALAGLCFALLASGPGYGAMALLHGAAGLCAGAGLSVTHGTLARGSNPHRLFAMVGMALGVFAVFFLGIASQLVQAQGSVMLFGLFGGVMALASVVSLLAFPALPAAPAATAASAASAGAARATAPRALSRAVWFGIVGVCAMALVQAMTFSFMERVGRQRGFDPAAITGVLIALGFVNLLPAVLAAVLQKRLSAPRVLLGGAAVQAALSAVIMTSAGFWPYALAAAVFAAVMIFTHTFAFGLLAQLDNTGRALAATPAMLMVGAAIGPILGGTLVKTFGYESIAIAAVCAGALALACFAQLRRPPMPSLDAAGATP